MTYDKLAELVEDLNKDGLKLRLTENGIGTTLGNCVGLNGMSDIDSNNLTDVSRARIVSAVVLIHSLIKSGKIKVVKS